MVKNEVVETYPSICLEGLKKNYQVPGRESNSGPLNMEYLPTCTQNYKYRKCQFVMKNTQQLISYLLNVTNSVCLFHGTLSTECVKNITHVQFSLQYTQRIKVGCLCNTIYTQLFFFIEKILLQQHVSKLIAPSSGRMSLHRLHYCNAFRLSLRCYKER
jgi:hypothetical protein